jgi:hypothetical protein
MRVGNLGIMANESLRRILTRALHETLDAYVSPEVRQKLLRDALAKSDLKTPPETRAQVERFVYIGLRAAATEALGPSVTAQIVEELSFALAAVQTASERVGPTQRPSTRPTPKAVSVPPLARIPKAAPLPDFPPSDLPRAAPPEHRGPASSRRPGSTVDREAQRPLTSPIPGRSTLPAGAGTYRMTSTEPGRPRRQTEPAPGRQATDPKLRRGTQPRLESLDTDPSPRHPTEPKPSRQRTATDAPIRGFADDAASGPISYFRRTPLDDPSGLSPGIDAPRTGSNRPSAPLGPVVLLALTRDEHLLEALVASVAQGSRVLTVPSVFALVRTLDDLKGQRAYVLFDAQRPTMRAEALAALADELSKVKVMLCRADVRVLEVIERISPATRAWVRLGQAWGPRDVAGDLARLVS